MTNGPVEVAFFVFSDFMNYKSGVYEKSAGASGPEGGHAVKAVGWGTESVNDTAVDYWIIANRCRTQRDFHVVLGIRVSFWISMQQPLGSHFGFHFRGVSWGQFWLSWG